MVNLKYIENPFTDDYLVSFQYLRNEKLFYDCVNRRILDSNSVFENLGSSFYTYLLTNEWGEWIGYILFHNIDCVDGYINVVQLELERLLLNLKKVIIGETNIDSINKLMKSLKEHRYSDTLHLSELKEEVSLLNNSCVDENRKTLSYFSDYYSNTFNYLYNFKEYYYLDIVIGLSFDSKKDNIESIYYGFISETYKKVENLINDKFNNIPIILKNTNSSLYLVNNEPVKIKFLDKKNIAIE